ncbi:hypothetical protein [Methanocella arvoryzae]|uniref:hypothetical protein n=1 Tax=Methanocella arvoryzae TaxID=1175445 RepID=UPI00064FA4D3|nr:hypothetical protein [Methanocella arvoryzae]
MKSGYIAIAVVAMITAVTLLSGCTSGPAMNATVTPTVMATVAPTAEVDGPMTSVDAQNVSMAGTVTPWPDVLSGNNTSIINTSEGMREIPNEMLAGVAGVADVANDTTMGDDIAASPVVSPTAMP